MLEWQRIKQRAKLIRPLIIPLILYIGALAFALQWLGSNPASSWRLPVAILPTLPAIAIAIGLVRAISRLDEMERRILIDGTAFSYLVTILLVLTMGMLGIAGLPQLNGIYIAAIMLLLWLVGKLLGNRRYQ